MDISSKIEAILFWKGEPITRRVLASYLHASEGEIDIGIATLDEQLRNRGIMLMQNEDEVHLATEPGMDPIIEELTKKELSRDLGKASLETLSIILYQGPMTRADIDYIRGVNSTFIIRSLMVRGLIERTPHERDQRSFMYKATFDALAHLGIRSVAELPEYEHVRKDIAAFKAAQGSSDQLANAENQHE